MNRARLLNLTVQPTLKMKPDEIANLSSSLSFCVERAILCVCVASLQLKNIFVLNGSR